MQQYQNSKKNSFFFPLIATIILFLTLTSSVNASTGDSGSFVGLLQQLYDVLFTTQSTQPVSTTTTISDTSSAQNPSEPPPPPPVRY
ncbi:MAG: hypothetical protein HY964_06635 [Ignavibacteriales bacterium]|nr:hypothetical protein [Ignavibacteriales bacterium]